MKPQEEIYTDQRKYTMIAELLRRVAQVPGVESAAIASSGPFTGPESGRIAQVPGGNSARLATDAVTPGFFGTIGMNLVAGRDFNGMDKPGSPLVAVLNQAAARALYGDANPIGRIFQWMDGSPSNAFQVIGVVANVHYHDLYGAPQPMVFFTYQVSAAYMPVLHVRTVSPATASTIDSVRRAFDDVDKGFPVFNIKTLAAHIDDALVRERLLADLAAAFGTLALLLAAVGLYGVLAYSVTRRTREIGIRMALGSGAGAMVWMVAREALQLVLAGCAAGVAISLALGKTFAAYLSGVSAADPLTVAAAATVILLTAAIAITIPAWRAARTEPLLALRSDG